MGCGVFEEQIQHLRLLPWNLSQSQPNWPGYTISYSWVTLQLRNGKESTSQLIRPKLRAWSKHKDAYFGQLSNWLAKFRSSGSIDQGVWPCWVPETNRRWFLARFCSKDVNKKNIKKQCFGINTCKNQGTQVALQRMVLATSLDAWKQHGQRWTAWVFGFYGCLCFKLDRKLLHIIFRNLLGIGNINSLFSSINT